MAKINTLRSTITLCSKIISTNSKPNLISSSSSSTSSKFINSPFLSSPIQSLSSTFRLASAVLNVVESQKPLHSAIASARLNSALALDSSCWSSLAIAFAVPR